MGGTLVVENVVKAFGGIRAVDEVSFTVEDGSFTALLGPNGSGKSTTLKMCTNLIQPDSGRVLVNGIDVCEDTVAALSGAGCVIETPEIYPDVTGRRYLRYLAMVSGLDSESAYSETERVLDIVGMSNRADGRIKTYSKGMRQRIVLAQALIGDPSLLMLDEPTSGLDPQGSMELGRILTKLNAEGKTILMSSHMLHEVEGLCDSAVIINHGRTARQGSIAEITKLSTVTVSILGGHVPDMVSRVSRMSGVIEVFSTDGGLSVRLDGGPDIQADIVAALVTMGARVYAVRKEDPLEEAFMDITRGDSG